MGQLNDLPSTKVAKRLLSYLVCIFCPFRLFALNQGTSNISNYRGTHLIQCLPNPAKFTVGQHSVQGGKEKKQLYENRILIPVENASNLCLASKAGRTLPF